MLKIETIKKMINDSDCDVRAAAMKICKDRNDVPVEFIEKGLCDPDYYVRIAAMKAGQNRLDVPFDLIEKGMRDPDWRVRQAAMEAYMGREDAPPSRTFDPPEKVYKTCVGGVIVVAHIPKDAHVRGFIGNKCRASKAKILDVIGDLYGERVGVSFHNPMVEYRVGDVVEIKNFDLSDARCSNGFHFYCTLDEAKNS